MINFDDWKFMLGFMNLVPFWAWINFLSPIHLWIASEFSMYMNIYKGTFKNGVVLGIRSMMNSFYLFGGRSSKSSGNSLIIGSVVIRLSLYM